MHVLFEAQNPQAVKELNDTAKLPYARIVRHSTSRREAPYRTALSMRGSAK